MNQNREARSALTLGMCLLTPLLLVSCSDDSNDSGAKSSRTPKCEVSNAQETTRSFIYAKGWSPSCVKAKRGVEFTFGNVDATAHTVSSAKDAPQPFTANLPHKNSLFSVKLTKPGTYHVVASGGATLTVFVT